MSYIPDYRKETDKLNEVDKSFVIGFRIAVESMKTFFDNLDDEERLTIEKEITERVKVELERWMELEEIEAVCSLFDNADYLPENIELVDANKPIFETND
jgi:hypothetical protein